MTISVIKTELVGDNSRGTVTITSDLKVLAAQIEELAGSSARECVLKAAVLAGIKGSPGISGLVDPPYPVNSTGETIENLKDENDMPLPPQHQRAQPVAYRARYAVTARQ